MVPGSFVFLERFPLSANGKVDRTALAGLAEHSTPAAQFVAARTAAEVQLAAIWAGVLGREQVGIHDNFFELGGDSILSLQVVARARQAGLQLTPKLIFQHQSIAELAPLAAAGTGAVAVGRRAGDGERSAAFDTHPTAFSGQRRAQPEHYNQALMLQVPAGVSAPVLAQAVEQLLVHHDALRLRFRDGAGGWQQCMGAQEEETVFTHYD